MNRKYCEYYNKPYQKKPASTLKRQNENERIKKLAAEFTLDNNIRLPSMTTESRLLVDAPITTSYFESESSHYFNYDDETNVETQYISDNHESSDLLKEIESQKINKINSTVYDNNDLICTALLSLFYSAHFTRDAFAKVIEFAQLLTNVKIPKSFDQLMKHINEEKLEYSKVFFCQKCVNKVELNNSKQRTCELCNER